MAVGAHRSARRWSCVGALAVAFGIGAALFGGIGVAYADGPTGGGTSTTGTATDTTTDAPPSVSRDHAAERSPAGRPDRVAGTSRSPLSGPERPSRTRSTIPSNERRSLTAARDRVTPRPAVRPPDPAPTLTSEAPTPSPQDEVSTEYGDIGKWMVKPNGQIANWGGKVYGGKTLLESINVIIVDPMSTSGTQAARRLNHAMFWSGFPAQPFHSTGFSGSIDEVTYGQKPRGLLQSYSNNFFLFRNDHGRIFGPDPVQTATGFVWSGAFSTEEVGFTGWLPGHVYVSSDRARDALVRQLVGSGQATYGGLVPMENAYNTDTVTTGDHDGFAVVLVLRGNAVLLRRDPVVGGSAGLISAGVPRGSACTAGPGTLAARTVDLVPSCGVGRPPRLDTRAPLSYS
ncbi:MAG: hypothetical protein ACSLFA_10120 [Mycobacterium sp.]